MPAWNTRWTRCFASIMVLLATTLLPACYTIKVALHHNDLVNSRRRVEDVLDDPQTPHATRTSLAAVERILAFAKANGLNAQGAYGYYIELDRSVVSFLVQAAQADRLQAVTWWFPVVGSVPYLGFFDIDERDRVAKSLEASGLDVHRGAAGAFSSLGWFDDPIFSSMLKRSVPNLAHLFLHELTHRTLWVPGSTSFNENLAEYVGETLAIRYLEEQGSSSDLRRFVMQRSDRRLFQTWLAALRGELKETYERLQRQGADKSLVLEVKRQIFARHTGPLKPRFELVDYVAGEAWNNASVLGASLYAPDMKRFARAQACAGGTVRQLLTALERRITVEANAEAALNSVCGPSKSKPS